MITLIGADFGNAAETADFTHLDERQVGSDHRIPDIGWQVSVIDEYRGITQTTQLITAAAISAIGLGTACQSLAIHGNVIR